MTDSVLDDPRSVARPVGAAAPLPTSPAAAPTRSTRAARRARPGWFRRIVLSGWRRELLLVGVLYLIYDSSRLLADGNEVRANRDGLSILHAEQWLHLDCEHWLNTGLFHLPVLPAIAALAYESLHYLITPTVLIWLYFRRSARYPRARNWLVTMTLSGLVGFWFFPAAPPRTLPGQHFHDIVAEQARWGWWSNTSSAPHGLGSFINEFAAMPSLHVGWALWAGWQLFRGAKHRWVRWFGFVYPAIIALVVMSTANHYLLDVAAGVGVTVFGWAVARWVLPGIVTAWSARLARSPRWSTRADRAAAPVTD